MVGYFLQQQQSQQQQQQQQQRTHEDIYSTGNKRWSSLSDNGGGVLNQVTHVSDLEKKYHTLAMADPNPGEKRALIDLHYGPEQKNTAKIAI